jgi:hypothetical protein
VTYLSPEQSQEKRNARMDVAGRQFEIAGGLAEASGLLLVRCSEVHYQLSPHDGRWLLNVYPSNRRLYRDPNRENAPYLDLPDNWTLLDVVRAAAEVLERHQGEIEDKPGA